MWWLLWAGCGPAVTWLDGTWRVDAWTAQATSQGATLLDVRVEDAGEVRFEGDGEMWSSVLYYDLPYVIGGAADLRLVQRVTWVYWAMVQREGQFGPTDLQIAWAQAYGDGGVYQITDRDDEGFTATNTMTYPLWPAPDAELVTTWRAVRAAEE